MEFLFYIACLLAGFFLNRWIHWRRKYHYINDADEWMQLKQDSKQLKRIKDQYHVVDFAGGLTTIVPIHRTPAKKGGSRMKPPTEYEVLPDSTYIIEEVL